MLLEFAEKKILNGLKIFWETAAAREYEVLISENGRIWRKVAIERNGKKGEIKLFLLKKEKVKFIKINMKTRTTQWGYSIWEIAWF